MIVLHIIELKMKNKVTRVSPAKPTVSNTNYISVYVIRASITSIQKCCCHKLFQSSIPFFFNSNLLIIVIFKGVQELFQKFVIFSREHSVHYYLGDQSLNHSKSNMLVWRALQIGLILIKKQTMCDWGMDLQACKSMTNWSHKTKPFNYLIY